MFLTKDHFLTIRITIPNPLLLGLLTFAIILSVTTTLPTPPSATPIILLTLATLIIPILTFPNISMQTHSII